MLHDLSDIMNKHFSKLLKTNNEIQLKLLDLYSTAKAALDEALVNNTEEWLLSL